MQRQDVQQYNISVVINSSYFGTEIPITVCDAFINISYCCCNKDDGTQVDIPASKLTHNFDCIMFSFDKIKYVI